MTQKTRRQFLQMAGLGVASLAAGKALASENPFGFQKVTGENQQLAAMEGKCGEGKCGGKMKDAEGKCGGKKDMEGKCGGKKDMEGKCGGKMKEGKCGGNKS